MANDDRIAPPMRRFLLKVLVLLLSVPALLVAAAELPAAAKDSWVRVRTANFTLYGSGGESKAKEIGQDLENLRAVLVSVRKSAVANSPVPTSVFVFPSDAALEPYKPRFQGKPRNLSAFFRGTSDGNYIALSARWNSDPRRIVYHEYIHYFLRSNFPPQPAWYEEGLAEFYSTFRIEGDEVQVGLPVEAHIRTLRESPPIPLERLLAIGRNSPEYNEWQRQGIFYAESW